MLSVNFITFVVTSISKDPGLGDGSLLHGSKEKRKKKKPAELGLHGVREWWHMLAKDRFFFFFSSLKVF